MKAVVKFNFEDGALFFSGTSHYSASIGDLERYSDEAITWCEDVEDAHIYDSKEDADLDAVWFREIFAGCSIDVVPLP